MEQIRRPESGPPDLSLWVPVVRDAGRFAICGVVVLNVLNVFAIASNPRVDERYWFLLDGESNPTTWLSTTILLGAAVLAMACREVDVPRRRPFFSLLCLVLLAAAFDEVSTVHERVGGNLADAAGNFDGLGYLWVIPWSLVAVAAVVLLWRTRPQLPEASRRGLLWGGATAVGGAVIGEVLRPSLLRSYSQWGIEVLTLTSVEENLEMIGGLIIGWVLARHALAASRHPEPPS